MMSKFFLHLSRAEAGDVVFFRRLSKEKSTSFESAIIDVSKVDSDVYHVGMVVDKHRIVHALPDCGVVLQNLQEVIENQKPDVIEVGFIDLDKERKAKALEFALKESGRAAYNDIFSPEYTDSRKRRAFYCCQLVVYAYTQSSVALQSPFLEHQLNFQDRQGEISSFWIDYYRRRGTPIPQGKPGSHPSKLRASPIVTISALRSVPADMSKLTVPRSFLQNLHYVGGTYTALGTSKTDRVPVFEPRSGKLLAEFSPAKESDVNEIIELAKSAQHKWASTSWQERGNILREAGRLIRLNIGVLSEWEVRDNGKPISEAEADVLSCAETFEYFSNAELGGQYLPYAGNSSDFAYTVREPCGVVGCIGAWNYPIQTATWKIAPAIACGNSVLYKPSPLAPVSSALLAQLLSQAGLPDGICNIVQGDASTGTAMCKHPDIRKISFTGSLNVGKQISHNAMFENIKPVTLELGGKSACIMLPDVDVDTAVNGAMMANFFSQGQVCSNASKVLVHKSIVGEFTKRLVAKVEELKIGDPFDKKTRVGAMISHQQMNKVMEFITDAVNDGAELLCGGKKIEVADLENGYYLSPAVLRNVQPTSRAYVEEIFGPVMLIVEFSTEDEALTLANEPNGGGLAAGLFTNNLSKAHKLVGQLKAGNVYVNTYNNVSPWVPFGAYGQSGIGRENGKAVIEHYSQTKSVFMNATGRLDDAFEP